MELYKDMADVYDIFYKKDDVNFWQQMAHHYGAPVLEIGVGTGRIAIELAKAGFEVVGLDNSKEMLSVMRKKAKGLKGELGIVHDDMTSFSIAKMFRTITIPFSTFQHLLTTKEQEACLAAVKKHLLEEGVLVIDVFNPKFDDPSYADGVLKHQDTMKDKDGTIYTKFSSQTHNKTLQTINAHFFLDMTDKQGRLKRITTSFKLKYFYLKDLRKLLESNGFRVKEVYGDYRMNRFNEREHNRLIVVAQKG